jgi:DNA repair exonuclease SbcCD nuclease subunit
MKIVFTADTHIGLDHPQNPRTPRRHRGPDFLANLDRVLAHAVSTGADVVLHGGDVFDTPNVRESLVEETYARLVTVAERGLSVVVIGGNHERAILPPSLLSRHPRLHILQGAQALSLPTPAGNLAVVGIPFVRGDVRTAVRSTANRFAIPRADVSLLLLHQAVEGATVGPQNFVFRGRPDVVPLEGLAAGFDAVLSGHIHRAQVLWAQDGSRRVPVVYPGSVERTSVAEADEPKSFVELRFDTHGKRWLTRHPLPARPMVTVRAAGATRRTVVQSLVSQLTGVAADAVVRIAGEAHALELLDATVVEEVFPAGMSLHWARQAAPEPAVPASPPPLSRMDRQRLALFAG